MSGNKKGLDDDKNNKYSTLLQSTLNSNINDITRLTELRDDICMKDELDIILNNI